MENVCKNVENVEPFLPAPQFLAEVSASKQDEDGEKTCQPKSKSECQCSEEELCTWEGKCTEPGKYDQAILV